MLLAFRLHIRPVRVRYPLAWPHLRPPAHRARRARRSLRLRAGQLHLPPRLRPVSHACTPLAAGSSLANHRSGLGAGTRRTRALPGVATHCSARTARTTCSSPSSNSDVTTITSPSASTLSVGPSAARTRSATSRSRTPATYPPHPCCSCLCAPLTASTACRRQNPATIRDPSTGRWLLFHIGYGNPIGDCGSPVRSLLPPAAAGSS